MLCAVVDNFLRGSAADVQYLAHLVDAGAIDVDDLSSLSTSSGAAAIWSRYTSLVRWRRFANRQHIDFLAVGQGSREIERDEISLGQCSACRLQQLVDARPCWQRVHSGMPDRAGYINVQATTGCSCGAAILAGSVERLL